MIYKVFILYSFLIKEVYLCFSRQAQNVFNFIPKGFDFSVTQRARDVFKNTALHFALVIMRALRTKAVLLYPVGVVVFDQVNNMPVGMIFELEDIPLNMFFA